MNLENGKIQVTEVFDKLFTAFKASKYHVFVLEGGSRSSKTISIIQFWLLYAQINAGNPKRIIISRAVATWLTGTVLNDFLVVLKAYGWYSDKAFNKTLRIYKLFDTEFWFIGLDDEQKLHGMTSDGFWINEAIESSKDDFDQLEMRSGGLTILDYNPTVDEHWIYDSVCKREDCCFIHSTMLDNAFLPDAARRKILSYQPSEANFNNGTADKNKWEIYGLGLRAKIEGLIFENFTVIPEIPVYVKKRFTCIDFGYTNDVTAIAEVGIKDNALYLDELCYKTHMLTKDIIEMLKEVNSDRKIISESADPRLIDEIYNAGFDIHAVEKGPGSVKAGIDKMKSMQLFVTKNSMNAIKEYRNYKNKQDKNGKWLNEPIDDFNHLIDGERYVVLMELLGQNRKQQRNLSELFRL